MFKIATLNKISPVGLALLGKDYSITEDLNEANGILVRSQDMQEMEFSKNLYAIARAGAGVNNIPCDRCAEEGIVVFNTPGANANAVAELAIGSMIADARNMIPAIEWANTLKGGEMEVAKAVEKGKGKYAGHELRGKKICVIGLGAIGVLVANACEHLGMQVVGYAPRMSIRAAHDMSNTIPFTMNIEDAIKDADYVSVHVPAKPNTTGMINASLISKMKDGVTIVNFSRDKLVNEPEVLTAIQAGKVRRYITDFPNDVNIGQPGVAFTPHLGASSEEAEDNCASAAVREIMNYIEDGNIQNSVNFPNCDLGKFIRGEGHSRICILNKNIPAVIGAITGILAEMNVNIDNMINKSKGKYAYTVIEADSEVDEEMLREKLASHGVIKVRVIK